MQVPRPSSSYAATRDHARLLASGSCKTFARAHRGAKLDRRGECALVSRLDLVSFRPVRRGLRVSTREHTSGRIPCTTRRKARACHRCVPRRDRRVPRRGRFRGPRLGVRSARRPSSPRLRNDEPKRKSNTSRLFVDVNGASVYHAKIAYRNVTVTLSPAGASEAGRDGDPTVWCRSSV